MEPHADRHREAAARHDGAARHHAEAAAFWEANGDPRRPELSRRGERLEAELARLEADWAELIEEEIGRPPTG